MQQSLSIVNLIGPDTSHVIQGNLFHTNTFIEFLKKQIKLKLVTGSARSNLRCLDYWRAYGLQETCKRHFIEYTRGTWLGEKL